MWLKLVSRLFNERSPTHPISTFTPILLLFFPLFPLMYFLVDHCCIFFFLPEFSCFKCDLEKWINYSFLSYFGAILILLIFLHVYSANGRRYLAEYERLIKDEYPVSNVQNNNYRTGKFLTLFPFKRMFVVCSIWEQTE